MLILFKIFLALFSVQFINNGNHRINKLSQLLVCYHICIISDLIKILMLPNEQL